MATAELAQVHGNTRPGEFLTGLLNFFQIATTIPAYPTNVKAPLAQVLAAQNLTTLADGPGFTVVDGLGASVTYTTDALYTDAYNKQANLDLIVATFATRANPVIVNAYYVMEASATTVLANGVNAVNFGSAYATTNLPVYWINFATEKSPAWLVQATAATDNTNATGYQLLGAYGLQGLPVYSTTGTVPAGPADAGVTAITVAGGLIETVDATNRNLIATVRSAL